MRTLVATDEAVRAYGGRRKVAGKQRVKGFFCFVFMTFISTEMICRFWMARKLVGTLGGLPQSHTTGRFKITV